MVLGVAIAIAGVVLLVRGVLQAVDAHDRIDGDAVGRGVLRAGARTEPVAFAVPAGGRRDYTVYLRIGGFDSDDQDLVQGATGCTATLPDGETTTFSGARQSVSVTLGDAVSVGHFSSQPGRVRVRCALADGRSGVARGGPVAYVVTPGKPSFSGSGVLTIFAGVGVGIAGMVVAVLGLVAASASRRR